MKNWQKNQLIRKQADVPALVQACLMQELGVVIVKSSKENLTKNAKIMQTIKYPYVLTEDKEYNDFLACTLRRCFVKDKEINKVIQVINTDFIRK